MATQLVARSGAVEGGGGDFVTFLILKINVIFNMMLQIVDQF